MGIKKELKPAPTSVVHSTARSLSGPQTHQGYQRTLFPLPAFFPQLCICCTLSFIIPAVAYSFFFVCLFSYLIFPSLNMKNLFIAMRETFHTVK